MDDHAPRLPALVACLATILGGSAVVAARFAVSEIDPTTLAFLRHAGAGLLIVLLAAVIVQRQVWRAIVGPDLPAILVLGATQYAVFGWMFAAGLTYVPAGRGALALGTYPIQTLLLAALLGRDAITQGHRHPDQRHETAGKLGHGQALAADGPEVWKGDALLIAAAFLGSVYNVFSGPHLRRYSALAVTAVQMLVGVLLLLVGCWVVNGSVSTVGLSLNGWLALTWLVTIGGAVCFYLWIWALEHTVPSRVSIAVTLNPIAAALFGALILAEPLTGRLAAGLIAVVAGLALVNWPSRPAVAVPR